MELQQPANTTTGVTIPVTLYWRQWPTVLPHTYQIATDYQFLSVVTSSSVSSTTENFTSGAVSLNPGTKYYWRVRNATGSYSGVFEFTTVATAVAPGLLNITVRDEQTYTLITNYSAQLYNTTSVLNKTTTNGYVNFSATEVSSGQYLVQIIPNSTYAQRMVLVTSPINTTVYLPSTTNTIDTIAFYLLDYTGRFPWASSIISISKNGSVMDSSYFDADAKHAVYLIRGDSYTVSVQNPSTGAIQEWGNYVSVTSANVEVVVMNIGLNTTVYLPYDQRISYTTSEITVSWDDNGSILNNLNVTILQGASRALVYNLDTSIQHGTVSYLVTNSSDIYWVFAIAATDQGFRNNSQIIDWRTHTEELIRNWGYGTATIPAWVKSAFAVIAMFLLAGSFGALHRGEGAIITAFVGALFIYYGILTLPGVMASFFAAMVLFAILYMLEGKRRQGAMG